MSSFKSPTPSLPQGQTLLREIAALQARLEQERTQRSFLQTSQRDSKDQVAEQLAMQVGRCRRAVYPNQTMTYQLGLDCRASRRPGVVATDRRRGLMEQHIADPASGVAARLRGDGHGGSVVCVLGLCCPRIIGQRKDCNSKTACLVLCAGYEMTMMVIMMSAIAA